MMALYNAHSPDKTSEVDKLLAKYEGKEEAMWSKLKKKYGETAIEEATAAAKLSSSTDLRAVDPDRTFAESTQKMESHSREKDSKILEKASADNTPEGEAIANMRLHERELMSKDLTKAHEEYDKRDHHTVAQDVGHLGAETEASMHLHDKASADNTPEGEAIANLRLHERELMSKDLAKAHEEYDKRDHHTVAQDVGHLGAETEASKHHHDKATADNVPEAEYIANMRLHERELMSKDLTKAHEEYDKRDHHTVAQDVGHLGADTVASAHHHDKATADNVPEAEYINSHNVHAREEASALLAQEHEKHSKRKKHTVPQDMGHVTTGVSLLVPLIIFDVHQPDTLHCSGG